MKFKLNCIFDGETKEEWVYDNLTNKFFDPDGNDPLQIFHVQDYAKAYPFWGEDTQFKFRDELLTLTIHLGLHCNFHCKYCHQTDIDKDFLPEATPSKVASFVEKLKRSGLKVEKEGMINFWGGEPLVYWKTLKLLVPSLKELFPTQRFSLVTNGSLLDEEKIQFMEKYNINVIISYDGKDTFRDYPVFDKPEIVEVVKSFSKKHPRKISILPLQTSKTQRIVEMKDELYNRIGILKESVCQHSLPRCNDESNSFLDALKLSPEKRKQIEDDMFETLMGNYEDNGLESRFDEFINSIARGVGYDGLRGFCPNSLGAELTVNLDGGVLICMNLPKKTGGDVENFRNIKFVDFYSWQKKEPCLRCPYINICHGLCPLIKDTTSEAFKVSCENEKAMASSFFRAAVTRLFGRILQSIEPLPKINK